MTMDSLVSCEWLKEQLDKGNPDIKVLDGDFKEYQDGHIPGAVRFDPRVVADKNAEGMMLPPAEQFAQQVGEMGVANSTHVVVYDNNPKFGLYSAGRVWWMFKIFGHEKVSVMDGGLPCWASCGYPVEKGPQPPVTNVPFTATFNPSLLRNLEQVKQAQDDKSEQIIDARPKDLFDTAHILGAINVPFTEVLDPKTKKHKSKEGIRKAFESNGVDLDKPLLTSCLGGLVSPMLAMSLYQLGKNNVPVYDGSWAEWEKKAPHERTHFGLKEL